MIDIKNYGTNEHGIGNHVIDKNETNIVVYHIFSFITPIFYKMQVTMNVLQLNMSVEQNFQTFGLCNYMI